MGRTFEHFISFHGGKYLWPLLLPLLSSSLLLLKHQKDYLMRQWYNKDMMLKTMVTIGHWPDNDDHMKTYMMMSIWWRPAWKTECRHAAPALSIFGFLLFTHGRRTALDAWTTDMAACSRFCVFCLKFWGGRLDFLLLIFRLIVHFQHNLLHVLLLFLHVNSVDLASHLLLCVLLLHLGASRPQIATQGRKRDSLKMFSSNSLNFSTAIFYLHGAVGLQGKRGAGRRDVEKPPSERRQ